MTVTRVSSGGLEPGIEIRLKASDTPISTALSFENSPGTGIYSPSQHSIAIATNGIKRLEIDESGEITGTFKSISTNVISAANTGTYSLSLVPSSTVPGPDAYEPITIDPELTYNAATDTLGLPNISLSGNITASSADITTLNAGTTNISGNLVVSGTITGNVSTTVTNATNSTNANFLNVGSTGSDAYFPVAMWGLEVGSYLSGRRNANLSYNPVPDILRIGNLRVASFIQPVDGLPNLYVAPDLPGEARIGFYNGGLTAEWRLGQRTSSQHNFVLSKSVAGTETDYLTIDTSGNATFAGILNTTESISVDGVTVIGTDRKLEDIKSIWKTITVTATSKTLTNREHCTVTASGQSITLPASPEIGWEVVIGVNDFDDTIVLRNGSKIMGITEDLTIDIPYAVMQFLYTGTDQGWRLY